MKAKNAVVSVILAISMIIGQVPFAALSLFASAADASSSREDIASEVFGLVDGTFTKLKGCKFLHYTGAPEGSISPEYVYVKVLYLLVDPRITGTFSVTINGSDATTVDENRYAMGTSQVGGYPNPCLDIIYTPSAEDIANRVCVASTTNCVKLTDIQSGSETDVSRIDTVTSGGWNIADSIGGSLNSTWYTTLTAGQPKTFGAAGRSYAVMLGDIANYAENNTWTVDPTSSFASTSVSKYCNDSAFSAEFTTNSDGIVIYSSSDTSVATISANGTITIVGAGTTVITASTPLTSAYNADSKTMTLVVSKRSQTVSVTSPVSKTYNQAKFNLNAAIT